ncbi:uncharacterized protein LOC103717132 isoform X3 [Phoenix dactylifera]|uniref:Uncharacterized protein LOC103717132 isoform X3 n=1 Tax=Phoenix dactylifera TaxID=42345 RepID=A0A8B8ZWF3_PHODC|nr:uncharacterized protein LOC103717132 isoform X3 [Phoenix dactylifera]
MTSLQVMTTSNNLPLCFPYAPGLVLKKERCLLRRKGNYRLAANFSTLASHSYTNFIQATMGGSKLKNHNFTSPRRQSLRLKALSAIYEAEVVNIANLRTKHQQQFNGGNCSTVAKRIKVEVLEPEEGNCTSKSNEHVNDPTECSYPEKHIYEETNTDHDDQSLSDLTLKDLRASCKAKKKKVLKSVASAEVGLRNYSHVDPSQKWKHEHEKPKEEKPDLEEPLVTLKLSKKSTADRNQRKHAGLSPVSLGSIEAVTAKTCSLSSNDMHGSMPVAQMKASIADRPSEDSAADLHDLKSEAETVEEDFGGSAKENFIEVDHSLLSSTTYAGSSELVCHFKTEIMEPCSLDGENTVNIATNSTLDIISSGNSLDDSSAELLQKVSEGLNNCFPSSSPDLKRTLHVDSPELVYTIKREILENDSPLHQNPVYVAASSTVDFIAKFNYSEKLSTEPFGRHEDVLENGGSNSSSNTSTNCCLNEVSTEYIEPDQCSLSENEEHANEIRKMDLSEMSNRKLRLSLVSIHKAVPFDLCSSGPASMTIDPGADIPSASSHSYRSMDIKVAEACASVWGHEDSRSLAHYLPVQQMPICSHIEHATNACSLLCKEHDLELIFNTATEGECSNNSAYHPIAADERSLLCREHDLDEIFNTGLEGECLHNTSHHSVAGDEQINSNDNESISTHLEEFSEAYNLYSPKPSHTCCGALAESSCKTEELSSKEGGRAEEVTSYSVEISGVNDPEGLTRAPDSRSPKISPTCFSTLSGLHCADSLSKVAGEFSSFGVEGKLHAAKDQPASSEISQLVDAKGQNMEKEHKHDKGLLVAHSPQRLLSNRKTISPTSQEKLWQALSDIDLYGASQLPKNRKKLWSETWTKTKTPSSLSGQKEAEALLAPEQMSKKPKNHSNASLLSVNKGILKSPDASCRSPCFCMKNSTFHEQTEKAVEFSQRQMHDIENIAMKLLKGLKSMKNIVEETLCSESCSSLPSKFTADEIRAAVENASKLEKITRRWLSMMTKDCNRFCKIMRLAENKETTPVNGVSKKRKKITFADEAGGVLCQVKDFRQQPAPVVVRETGKDDMSHVLL